MQTLREHVYVSLGDQVSHKISAWILVLITAVIVAILTVSFALSWMTFNKQVNIWNSIVPKQILTNLIDSDHFSIKKEMEFLQSTELFSSVVITDNKQEIIAQFGNEISSKLNQVPIEDSTKVVWGYYHFKLNFYHFISPFLFAAIVFFILAMLVYFIIRWRIKLSLESEFSRFNHFLKEIEVVTEHLHEIYNQDTAFKFNLMSSNNHEQVVIYRAINRLLDEIRKANQSLREAISFAEQKRFQEELTRTALQVVHDIASPIAVLQLIQSSTKTLPEESRVLIRNVVSRIHDISNTLLKKAKQDFSSERNNKLIQQMLYVLINQVISEKRMQYGDNVNIDFQFNENSYKIFSFINPAELSRVLSNLLNNSVEAIGTDRRIIVSLTEISNSAMIQIQDYGQGIPENILSQLGGLGKSFGKSQGTGVGLHHAMNTIKDWAGQIDIKSKEGEGTTIQILLPKCKSPSWFVPEIAVRSGQRIVIVDDDEAIHTIWDVKFKQFCTKQRTVLNLLHFREPEELLEWHKHANQPENTLYLCDYEFIGSQLTGLDLIKKLQIKCHSILVTNNTISDIISRCELEEVKLLPKNTASSIAIINV